MDVKGKKIWIGSPTDVRQGAEAEEALKNVNDAKYWNDEYGILEVDEERWKLAQQYELQTWQIAPQATTDRNDEHFKLFEGYQAVPDELGNVIELGCGPFTQLQTILKGRTAEEITLLDPLLEKYLMLPNCTYKDGLHGYQPKLMTSMIEEMPNFYRAFDTIIMINVLEHVQSVPAILRQIAGMINYGGTLIFGENTWDHINIHHLYDVGHPIRIKQKVIDEYKKNFEILHQKKGYFIGRYHAPTDS